MTLHFGGRTLGRAAVLVVATIFFAAAARAQSYDVLYVFGTDAAAPYAGLIQAADGNLYGTTLSCGASSGYGTIFKIDTAGTNFSVLFTFGPDGQNPDGLIQATDGNFYGTTLAGGSANIGSIFRIDAAGTTLTTLHSFTGSDGASPSPVLIQGTDGNLYGTTTSGGPNGAINAGTIFKIDTAGTTFTSLHAFTGGSDGAYPRAGLIQGTDGNLYGTTGGDDLGLNGTIFKIDTAGTTLTTLHTFSGSDGAHPYAGLIKGTDGNLYGTTYAGGASNDGTIFKFDTAGATLTTLHSFSGSDGATLQAGLIQGTDGNLYGTTLYGGASNNGTIFRIDTAGATLTILHSFSGSDGATPITGLIQAPSGNFYGTTYYGGLSGNAGTIFKIDTAGTTLTTLRVFSGSDGGVPYAGVIRGTDGNLYGTTWGGGANGKGTIFKVDAAGATLTTLHSFTGTDGEQPQAGLIQGTDGNLYGTTAVGGASFVGTIFKIDTAGTTLTTLHVFSGSDGGYPYAGLIQGTDGYLYGTTRSDGANGVGTIFKIDTAGVTLTTLHSFSGSDGAHSFGSLIQGTDGNLYGTTHHGGASDNGTIFKIDTAGVTLTTLHSFSGSDGANPVAGLIQGTDGNLYGTTEDGGANGGGTIFKIDTAGTTLTTLHSFTGSDGWEVSEGLIQGADGNLYGTTYIGGAGCVFLGGCGTIFKIDTTGATFTVLHSFDSGDGQNPNGLIQTADGKLYGTTSGGGGSSEGVAFRLAVCTVNDVLATDPFYPFICMILGDGITAGCGGGDYCPNDPVTRAQMAVFLLKAKHGRGYLPPSCTGIFQDVPCPGAFAVNWMEDLHNEAITAGCSVNPLLYCPTDPVTRAQMAVFLLKSKHGSSYEPPACTGIFQDVPCPSPSANWIEELLHEGITDGCSSNPLDYCPDATVNRAQMAVLLAKTFGLL
jgi:uncharacterized repeat protein (TIGR03803 family)